MSLDLLTTFSPNYGSYKTKTIDESVIITHNNNINSNNDRQISDTNHLRYEQSSNNSLLGALIKGYKNNCLLSYILGATLLASVCNTVLLSFVIKSLQLNDRGFIDGKINWDETIGTTILELATSLEPSKSISLNSIESHKNKSLNFNLITNQATTKNNNEHTNKKFRSQSKKDIKSHRCQVFLSTNSHDLPDDDDTNKKLLSSFEQANQQQKQLISLKSKSSSYMAACELDDDSGTDDQSSIYHDDDDGKSPKRASLEIGTKALKLNLLMIDANNLQYGNSYNAGGSKQQQQQKFMINPISRLLAVDFDDELRSISLPLEKELKLIPQQTNSITIESGLVSDNIVGSHDDNLRVQTRDGNLIVNSGDYLELISKSASVKVTTSDELSLRSPSMSFSSNQGLYLTNGIDYFDSYEPDKEDDKPPTGQQADVGKSIGQTTTEQGEVEQQQQLEPELIAHNLIIIDGIIKAETG